MTNYVYLNNLASVLDKPIGPAISKLNEFLNSPKVLEQRREKSPKVLALLKNIEELEAFSIRAAAQSK